MPEVGDRIFSRRRRVVSAGARARQDRQLSRADRRRASARPTRSIAALPTSILPRRGLPNFPRRSPSCRSADDVSGALERASEPRQPPAELAAARRMDRPLLRRRRRRGPSSSGLQSCDAEPARAGARKRCAEASPTCAQDHVAQHPRSGRSVRSALSRASSRITASRWRASPAMTSSRASAPPSSTRTASRAGARTRSQAVTPDIVDRHFRPLGGRS